MALMALFMDCSISLQIWEALDSFVGVSCKSGEDDPKSISLWLGDDKLLDISVLPWGNWNLRHELSLFPKNTDLIDRSRISNDRSQSIRAVGKAGSYIGYEKIKEL
jgi:hypothetical protein